MKNPFPYARWPLGRTRPLVRAAAYSSVLLGLLVYASYRWVYSHPFQVERRAEDALAALVTGRVRVKGASYSVWRGAKFEQLDVDAPRTAGGRRLLARLREVHVDAPEVACTTEAGALVPVAALVSEPGGARRVVVCSGSLHFESESRPGRAGQAESDGASHWNFVDALRAEAIWEILERDEWTVFARTVTAGFRMSGAGAAEARQEVEVRRLQVEGRDGELWVRGGLEGSSHWDDGEFEIRWTRESGATARGRLENVRGADAWLPFLPDRFARWWRVLKPGGTVAIDLRHLDWRPAGGEGGAGPAVDASVSFDIHLRHYDGTLHLPGIELALGSLSGATRLAEDGASWGAHAELEPARGKFWGQSCELGGRVAADGSFDLRLVVPPQRLALQAAGEAPRALGSLLAHARAEGRIEGEVRASSAGEAGEGWRADFELRDGDFPGVPFLSAARIKAALVALSPAVAAGIPGSERAAPPLFEGAVEVTGLGWAGLGRLDGELLLSSGAEGVELRGEGLALTPWRGAESSGVAAGGTSRGEVSILARFDAERGAWSLDLSWRDAALATRVLAADALAGAWSPAEGDGGEVTLRGVRVPERIAGEDALEFPRGRGRWSISGAGLEIGVLELSGPEAVLRARGRIGWDGGLDVVVVKARGRQAPALEGLADASPLSEWAQALGAELTAFRVSGSTDAPQSRPIDAYDRAFRRGDDAGDGGFDGDEDR